MATKSLNPEDSSGKPQCCAECEEMSEEQMCDCVDEIIKGHSSTKGALIPVLQSVQNMFGYLPKPVLKHISLEMDIPYSEVTGVVSFYSYFSTVPQGRNIIRVCLGTACYVRGGKDVLHSLKKHLDINVGETTDDREFSLDVGRCFGACGLAPVVMVNDDVYQRVKTSKIKEIIDPYRQGHKIDRKGDK